MFKADRSVRTGVSRPPARTTREAPTTNDRKIQSPEDFRGDPLSNTEPSMDRSFPLPQRVSCVGSCLFQGRPGSPGSDGASPYRLERRSMLRAIPLVVVIVLVLDLLWVNPSSRVTRAGPVRTEPPLPSEFASSG
jgi:hypothetical protein